MEYNIVVVGTHLVRVLTKRLKKELNNMTNMIPFNRGSRRIVPAELNHFNNMLDDFFSDIWSPARDLSRDTFKIDVQDDGENYLIEADMPGVDKKEISVELRENTLCIQVKREEKVDEEKKNYIHKERKTVSMTRNVYLGDVKQDEVSAKLEDGVLKITIPKIEETEKVKQIDIN